MTAAVEMGCWFTCADPVNEEVLRVWDGVRRELITYALQPAERAPAHAKPPAVFSLD